jgi:glycosyltransferase involved in cell wall biosynthesis
MSEHPPLAGPGARANAPVDRVETGQDAAFVGESGLEPAEGPRSPPGAMKICMPIHSFDPGGVERVGLRLAERWHRAGHAVTVVLGRDRGITRPEAPALDYRTRPEPFPTKGFETPWLIWCLWRYLSRLPSAEQPDILFCPGNTYTVVCVAMKLLLGRRCPPVVAKISNDFERRDMPAPVRAGYRKWLRVQGRMLDRFIATAPPMVDQAVEALGTPSEAILMIPNPILAENRLHGAARSRARREGRRFLAVGRLEPQKNYRLMIAAFARIAGPRDSLIIAGEGSERAGIEAAVARAGLASRVSLLGHRADPSPLYAEADVFAMSSDYEGLPGALVEALASGLPIAVTDCCASMRWLVGSGAFGVLAAPGDVAGFASAMAGAAALTPDRAAMRRFSGLFTLEQSAPRYIEAFAALAGKPLAGEPPSLGTTPLSGQRIAPC